MRVALGLFVFIGWHFLVYGSTYKAKGKRGK
jgi:hypothetical protein